MDNKILVTGGSGFVGRFLIEELLLDGSNTIVAMYNNNGIPDVFKSSPGNLSWIKNDLVSDDLTAALTDIDIVYHLAGYSSVDSSTVELDRLNKINVIATRRLADACVSAQVRHLIFVSSVAVCEGSSEAIIDEGDVLPLTPYGDSKQRAEDILIKTAKGFYEITILRPSALFGECHEGSVYELVKKIQEKRFAIFGSGKSLTNFLYIRDFTDLLVSVKFDPRAYDQIFIAADSPFQLKVVVDWILGALNSNMRVLVIPAWTGHCLAWFFDLASLLLNRALPFSRRRLKAMLNDSSYSNAKVTRVMGSDCKYGVQKGLLTTIQWYRDNDML